MANYATLKDAITDVIKTNGTNAITGALLQTSLLAMIDSLGAGYQFAGVATPETNPGTPDQKVFYIAIERGTYPNFGGSVVTGLAVLYYDSSWHVNNILRIDDVPMKNSVGVVLSGGIEAITTPVVRQVGNSVELESVVVEGAYFSTGGTLVSGSSWAYRYAFVQKGDIIRATSVIGSAYGGIGLYKEVPQIGAQCDDSIYSGDATFCAPYDCYVVVSSEKIDISRYEISGYDLTGDPLSQQLERILYSRLLESLTPTSKVNNYYIDPNGSWRSLVSQQVKIYAVTAGQRYFIETTGDQNYAFCSWFSSLPSIGSSPMSIVSYSPDINHVQAAPEGAQYVAISGYIGSDYSDSNDVQLYGVQLSTDAITQLQDIISGNDYYGKTCLYIGDSISTSDNYKWKGLIEDKYKLRFARNLSGQLAPADGGIALRPPQTESETLSQKSIWYRCAENRMAIYSFDMISLFGGTNDMTNSALPVGTVDDTPFVDDSSDFEAGTTTDVWTENLTFAQCLMGCILMLQRDFPGKEIVIPTVMYCSGIYGNNPSGLSESIAVLQAKIATKFGLKCIPFFWGQANRTPGNIGAMASDGVHPSLAQAYRMMADFAAILSL